MGLKIYKYLNSAVTEKCDVLANKSTILKSSNEIVLKWHYVIIYIAVFVGYSIDAQQIENLLKLHKKFAILMNAYSSHKNRKM